VWGSILLQIDFYYRTGNRVCLFDVAQAIFSFLGKISAGFMMQSGEREREIVLDAGFREEISLKKTPLTRKIQELTPRSVLKIDRNNPKP
jgi:hypothetical protein